MDIFFLYSRSVTCHFFYQFETQSAAFVRVHVPESEPVLYNNCSVDARESDFLIEMVYDVCLSLRV